MPPPEAFLHGASMVLLDGLGIGDGSSESAARRLRSECAAFLVTLLPDEMKARALAVLSPNDLPQVENDLPHLMSRTISPNDLPHLYIQHMHIRCI